MRVRLGHVIRRDGHLQQGADSDHEDTQRVDHVVGVVLEGGAADAEARGDEDHGYPEDVQAEFRLPDPAPVPPADVEGKGVVDEVAEDLGGEEAEPD